MDLDQADRRKLGQLFEHPGWKVMAGILSEEHASRIKHLRQQDQLYGVGYNQGFLDGIEIVTELEKRFVEGA